MVKETTAHITDFPEWFSHFSVKRKWVKVSGMLCGRKWTSENNESNAGSSALHTHTHTSRLSCCLCVWSNSQLLLLHVSLRRCCNKTPFRQNPTALDVSQLQRVSSRANPNQQQHASKHSTDAWEAVQNDVQFTIVNYMRWRNVNDVFSC